LKMIPEAGPFGFGPGTFQTAFPYFTHEYGNQLNGRWLYAHEDYLQTLVEWGYVGTALWVGLVGGAMVLSVIRAVRYRAELSSSVRLTHFAILLGVGSVLLHALVDFPLQIASIQLYSAALLGALWASPEWLCSSRRREASQWSSMRPRVGDIAAESLGQPPGVSRLP
jgi:O-antigen ligase